MDAVTLKPFVHHQQECIGIYFSNLPLLNEAVKKVTGCQWTKTFKCWQLPLSKDNYLLIASAFKEIAAIDNTALRAYLIEKKKTPPADKVTSPKTVNEPPIKAPILKQAQPARRYKDPKKPVVIHGINAHILPKMRELIILKGYSGKTETTYLNEMSQLLQLMGNKSADLLTPDMLKRYMVYCSEKLKLKENTLNSRLNALYPVGLKKET